MGRDFEELMSEIEQEARRGGPKATAEYAAFGAYSRLAREIFDLRKAAGLTQRQLAARSGVQQADISRIEAGDANPTLATIAALAYALGAEVSLEPQPRRKAVGEPRRRASQRTGTEAAARRHVEGRVEVLRVRVARRSAVAPPAPGRPARLVTRGRQSPSRRGR